MPDPNDLTTLARLKERLTITDTDRDGVLQSLITEVSLTFQRVAGRLMNEQTHTHYLDGTGLVRMWLPEGPLVSVTSLESLTYADDGSGGRDELPTAIDPFTYLTELMRGELQGTDPGSTVRDGPSSLYRSGLWGVGVRNFKITYVAGYDTLPESLLHSVTNLVAAKYHTREAEGLRGKDVEGGSIELISPAQFDEAMERSTAPWRYRWSVL